MLGENELPQINLAGLDASPNRHRWRWMLGLALLALVTLILVVVKYRHIWFESLSFLDATGQTTSGKVSESPQNVNPAAHRKSSSSSSRKQSTPSVFEAPMAESLEQEVVSAPLQVDVTYAGGRHSTLITRDSAIHLDLRHNPRESVTASSVNAGSVVINAAERVSPSPRRMEAVVLPADPIYPLLAHQMKVQGSVILQARIGKDGSVQSLHVVSGSDILASAALEAVSRWRFKPTYQAGRAVPAETRITVNFIISTP